MVHTSLETAYMTHFKDFLAKKHRLAIDAWGADDAAVRHVYQPLINHVSQEVPEKYLHLYPNLWKHTDRITRISRNVLISEYMIQEWADHFVGLSEKELEELAASYHFDNCVKRDGLNTILTENAKAISQLI